MSKKKISIVAPVFNEEKIIGEFIKRTIKVIKTLEKKFVFEILLVDDGSEDSSLKIMKEFAIQDSRIKVIEFRKNYGQTPALQAGIDYSSGDYIITMDADLQHFPEEIPNFINKLEEGYDVVCGWRYNRQEGFLRKFPSKIANNFIRSIAGFNIHDYGTTYRIYKSEIIKDIQLFGQQHRFIPVLAFISGAKITEIKIENIERTVGVSNYGISRTFNVLLDLLYLLFSVRYLSHPLRFFGKIFFLLFTIASGILFSMISLAYFFDSPGIIRERSGWFLSSLFIYITSFQVLLTGVLAEVLSRIYYFSENKRVYRVRTIWKNK